MERTVIRSRARRLGGLIPLTVAALLAASIGETHATTSSPAQVGNDINGEAANDYSGWSVAMSDSGTRIAIGAPYNGGTGSNAGHVRVYDLIGTTWTQVGADIDGEAAYDGSGRSVAMSANGTRIAIGAPYNGGSGSYAGHVRVYDLIGNTWTKVGADIDGEAAYDQSGFSVAMSANGTRIAIGATFNDGTATDAGHIRVYDLIGNTWTKVGNDIDGEATNDYSGRSVAMSANGTRIAIGAMGNDGTATDAGHVRVYDLIGTTWTQVGTDIDGEAAGDASGRSVAMSANGTQVAIGATANDGTAPNAGHVRVYTPQANPSPPTISSVTAGNGSLTVAFTAGTDGGSAITNYKYSTDGTTYTALSPASTSSPFTISGLNNGTTYSITIKAVNAVGDSTASNAMTGTPTAPATTTTTTTTTSVAPTTTSTTVVASSNTGGGATTSTTPTTTQGLPETGDDSSNLSTIALMSMAIGIVVAARRRSTTA
ncbi:MAG: LPXTG cell wall anchor domain-containing protein [Actinobacteria bacterium]|nr:LPXTG cell wall anchor domain-containing protein [Actinomycetota bacterium]